MSSKNYATGCAFSTDDIFMNFPYNKLKISCEECQKINGNPHRDILVKLIFRECLKIIINDIIDNNITFHLPTGSRKCNIHMKKVRGEDFKKLRQSGKWQDVDILESNFTGYEIGFYMFGNRTSRVKTIYLNKPYKDRITLNTNKGMQYGDSNKDKTISDYYAIVLDKFPQVSINDLKRILNFSWKSLYLHNSYGGDTFITDRDIWCYIGYLKYDSLEYFNYYVKKLSVKLRIIYRRKKIPWDGYYYFALTLDLYNDYTSLKNKKGRPKKKFTFNKVFLYLIFDDCRISEHSKKYIFRIPYIDTIKFKFYIEELTTDKAELIVEREPLKFKDILVYENEYEFL